MINTLLTCSHRLIRGLLLDCSSSKGKHAVQGIALTCGFSCDSSNSTGLISSGSPLSFARLWPPGVGMVLMTERCGFYPLCVSLSANLFISLPSPVVCCLQLQPDAVLLLYNFSGQRSGEALITFPSEESARRAVAERANHPLSGLPVRLLVCCD